MTDWSPEHPQVTLDGIAVDKGMAPLLRQIWGKGWRTEFSCQGGMCDPDGSDRLAYILFADAQDAWTFASETAEAFRRPDGRGALWSLGMRVEVTPPRPTKKGDPLRGVVRFNHRYLKRVTTIWKER